MIELLALCLKEFLRGGSFWQFASAIEAFPLGSGLVQSRHCCRCCTSPPVDPTHAQVTQVLELFRLKDLLLSDQLCAGLNLKLSWLRTVIPAASHTVDLTGPSPPNLGLILSIKMSSPNPPPPPETSLTECWQCEPGS